jgi:hypothetical protein
VESRFRSEVIGKYRKLSACIPENKKEHARTEPVQILVR